MPIKFDLERALQGDEVVDGYGDPVFDITFSNKVDSVTCVSGVSDGEWETYTLEGSYHSDNSRDSCGCDLYMKHASTDTQRKFNELDIEVRFPQGQLIL